MSIIKKILILIMTISVAAIYVDIVNTNTLVVSAFVLGGILIGAYAIKYYEKHQKTEDQQ